MKQYKAFLYFSLLLFAGTACHRQVDLALLDERDVLYETRPQMLLTATIEDGKETRTTLGGGSYLYYPLWSEDDEIAVFSGAGSPVRYSLQSGVGSREATFGGNQLSGDLIGLYPYSDITGEGYSDHVLTLELPSSQQYVPGSFGLDSYPMVAVSQSSTLTFKNLCAILSLSLTGSDPVTSIRFHAHAENIFVSGKATVRTDYETVPELIMSSGGSPDVTLQCDNVNLNPETPTEFFLVIPPGTYTGGFDLVISSATGEMSRSTDADITFERSQYRSVPAFAFVPEAKPIPPTPDAIDLGLSVKWASFNLGASSPEEYGDHYAWGDTEPCVNSEWSNYKWCNGTYSTITKYNNQEHLGVIDNKTVLDPEDDAASAKLGGNWRMPTQSEWDELLSHCNWEWTSINGVNGIRVTSTVSGYEGSQIFLPAAGDDWGYGLGTNGYYWSSSLGTSASGWSNISAAYDIEFDASSLSVFSVARFLGLSIRPVNDRLNVDNRIYYTSSDGKIVTPKSDAFGQAAIVSNVYEGGQGIITCDIPVTEIAKEAFHNSRLLSIELPSSLRVIGEKAFVSCDDLKQITIPEGVTTLGFNAFYSCMSLSSATIPSSLVTIGIAPFVYCSSLTSFYGALASEDHRCIVQDGVLRQYAPGAIEETYTIPAGVSSIGTWSFMTCDNLREIIIPHYVTKVESGSIHNLPNLLSIHISSGITEIGSNAFYYDTALSSITIEATTPPKLGNGAFDYTNNCPIYVPAQSVNTYKTAAVWNNYAERIVPIGGEADAVPEAIDLGLSVKWASFNLGASKPEDLGDFYAWGETKPYYSSFNPLMWEQDKSLGYDWGSYQFNPSGDGVTFTKYTGNDYTGLQSEDDAATVRLGATWRMATIDEWLELRNTNNCSWTWTENYQNSGTNGYIVTSKKAGYTDRSIFLPAAGDFSGTHYYDSGNRGVYWSSTLKTDSGNGVYAYQPYFSSDNVNWSGTHRFTGCSIRPVFNTIPVKSIILYRKQIELSVGESYLLIASITPENATNKGVVWSSSNSSVATVSDSGVVTGVAIGTATITVTTLDGGKTSSGTVTVSESTVSVAVPQIVDLGLSVKWASFNLGASSPEGYGDYFAWGEIEPYYSSLDPLVWKLGKKSGYMWPSYKWYADGNMTKYCTTLDSSVAGIIDGKTVLEPEDDAAHVHFGDKWRMPTKEEMDELLNSCTWTWSSMNGVPGYKVTGTNGHHLFLPAAGGWNDADYHGDGWGTVWTSSLHSTSDFGAYGLSFGSSSKDYSGDRGRYFGRPIRAVYDDN